MKTYKYKSYDEYVSCQKMGNLKKNSNVWASEKNIKFLAEYMRPRKPTQGLCHGVRGGYEQRWFMDHLLFCTVIGSEIGEATAPLTVKWDFNIQNPGWINKFDFIYSNSFDHTFNPEITINVWAAQIKKPGIIILEYDRRQEHTGEISQPINKTDPVSITFDELIQAIPKWIDGSKIIDVLDMPVVTQEWRKSLIIEVR